MKSARVFLNTSSNFVAVTFETRALPTLPRCCRRSFTLITRTAAVLAPATLAALPSTRAIPDRDVCYIAHPVRSIEATGTSVRQPFGLFTALVRNWSPLFLNRILRICDCRFPIADFEQI
jgi:hypothetical protein